MNRNNVVGRKKERSEVKRKNDEVRSRERLEVDARGSEEGFARY